MPGFRNILLQLADAYKNKRARSSGSGEFTHALSQTAMDLVVRPEIIENTSLGARILDEAIVDYFKWETRFTEASDMHQNSKCI